MGGAAAAGAAAAASAAIGNAIKASGAIVRVEADVFKSVLARAENALVVRAEGGMFSTKYSYLVSYKGLLFFTKSPEPIHLPPHIESIRAAKIWIPD
jgi:hypothetical protein